MSVLLVLSARRSCVKVTGTPPPPDLHVPLGGCTGFWIPSFSFHFTHTSTIRALSYTEMSPRLLPRCVSASAGLPRRPGHTGELPPGHG